MTISTFRAAKKLCDLSDWSLTNLKLQKILYIAHMVYLGENNGEPLINGTFEAWDYGPVVPELYHEVKKYGASVIRAGFFHVSDLNEGKEADSLAEAARHLFDKSAARLVNLTHRQGGGWEKNYMPSSYGIVIPNQDILTEYRNWV